MEKSQNSNSFDHIPQSNSNSQKIPFYLSDPAYSIYHNKILPPPEAYFYFPSGEEVFIYNTKKPNRSLRRIYYLVPYNSFETENLEKWHQFLEEKKFTPPSYWTDSDNLRYIYATGMDFKPAFKLITNHITWRANTFPMYIVPHDNIYKILNLGFIYCYGRDHNFHPIIVCQPYIYVKRAKEFLLEDWIAASVFLCHYVETYMLIRGQIENWALVTNLEQVFLLFLPSEVRKVFWILTDNFASRLYITYIIGLSKAMRFIYSIVVRWMNEITRKKLVVVNDVNDGTTTRLIRKDNLEEKFGGSAQNLEYDGNNLFPPRMPDNGGKFMFDTDDPKEKLITKEEYIKRMEEGKVLDKSPYVIKEIEEEKEREEEMERKIKEKEEMRKVEVVNDINLVLSNCDWGVEKENNTKTNSTMIVNKNKEKEEDIKEYINFNEGKKQLNWEYEIV